jgi:hypothetical protein
MNPAAKVTAAMKSRSVPRVSVGRMFLLAWPANQAFFLNEHVAAS